MGSTPTCRHGLCISIIDRLEVFIGLINAFVRERNWENAGGVIERVDDCTIPVVFVPPWPCCGEGGYRHDQRLDGSAGTCLLLGAIPIVHVRFLEFSFGHIGGCDFTGANLSKRLCFIGACDSDQWQQISF